MTHLRAALLLGAAGVAAAVWNRPSYCSELQPVLPSSPAESDFWKSMQFLDSTVAWTIDSNDFGGNADERTARFQILRLPLQYTASDGKLAPIMRIVGFFPSISPENLYTQMTDLTERRRWDSNYAAYDKYTGKFESSLHEEINRPLGMVAKKTPQCNGDLCQLIPDVKATILDNNWYSHRVGSQLLRRFGLRDRLFNYERITFRYELVGKQLDSALPPMYDVLFSGSRRAVTDASRRSSELHSWLTSKEKEGSADLVDVNFQHILILPIANFKEQLLNNADQFTKICESRSVLDIDSTRDVYNVFKDTCKRMACNGSASGGGSLLIMTSANHVSIPVSLPQWLQSTVVSTVSRQAYRHLMKACLEKEKLPI